MPSTLCDSGTDETREECQRKSLQLSREVLASVQEKPLQHDYDSELVEEILSRARENLSRDKLLIPVLSVLGEKTATIPLPEFGNTPEERAATLYKLGWEKADLSPQEILLSVNVAGECRSWTIPYIRELSIEETRIRFLPVEYEESTLQEVDTTLVDFFKDAEDRRSRRLE